MMHFLPILGFAWLGAAAPALPAAPEPAAEVCEASSEAPVRTQAASAGLKVVVDPETGEIVDRPTRRQLQRLSEESAPRERRDSWELREFELSGGGQGVFLDGWADQSLALEASAEGTAQSACSSAEAQTGVERSEAESR